MPAPQRPTYATPGKEPLVLLALCVQRLARAIGKLPGADAELLRVADADAMLVLVASGIDLPPKLRKIAEDRARERRHHPPADERE